MSSHPSARGGTLQKPSSPGPASTSSSRSTMPPPMSKRLFRRKLVNTLPNLVPIAVYFAHVLLAPYTKVEESFTLHAVHDVLAHGLLPGSLQKWDHITFPGAVPRSFLPPVLLGLATYPVAALGVSLGWIKTKVGVQVLVRLVLAFVSAQSTNHLSRTLRQRFGASVRTWFLILSVTQFHVPFYAGRTLPNFMALPFVTFAISLILRSNSQSIPAKVSSNRVRNAVIILTATATVIRLELAALLLPAVLSLVVLGRLSLGGALSAGLVGGLGSLALSAPLDFALWRPTLSHPDFPFSSSWQLVWPEITGLWYNLVLGKSSDWGESPWWYYLLNALPRILLSSLPLAVLAVSWWSTGQLGLVRPVRKLDGVGEVLGTFGPGTTALVAAMSCIGHKEWRFVVYVVPVINILAAYGASHLWSLPWRRLQPLVRLGLVGMILANLAVTGISTYISILNYPGGQVWRILEDQAIPENQTVAIHYTNYPLQSGASLFTFLHLPHSSRAVPPNGVAWTYSKSEDPDLQTPNGARDAGMDYVVLDAGMIHDWTSSGDWHVVGSVQGFGGWRRRGKWSIGLEREVMVYIVGRSRDQHIIDV